MPTPSYTYTTQQPEEHGKTSDGTESDEDGRQNEAAGGSESSSAHKNTNRKYKDVGEYGIPEADRSPDDKTRKMQNLRRRQKNKNSEEQPDGNIDKQTKKTLNTNFKILKGFKTSWMLLRDPVIVIIIGALLFISYGMHKLTQILEELQKSMLERFKEQEKSQERTLTRIHVLFLNAESVLDKINYLQGKAENYLYLGREIEAKNAIQTVKDIIMTSQSFTADDIYKLGSELVENYHIRAIILLRVAGDMYETNASTPDDVVNGIFSCISKTDDATRPLIEAGGRSRVIGLDIGVENMIAMNQQVKAVKMQNLRTKR